MSMEIVLDEKLSSHQPCPLCVIFVRTRYEDTKSGKQTVACSAQHAKAILSRFSSLSNFQETTIISLGLRTGVNVQALCEERFGKRIEDLTHAEGALLIEHLAQYKARRKAA